MVSVAAEAHCPADGVKVYVVVDKLSSAGDQVPVIPLSEVVGRSSSSSPAQIGATALKVGFTAGFTVMVIVAKEAH